VALDWPCYADNFFAICATCRPWNRAAASSFSLAMRSPLPPAIVDVPYGEPPVISSMRIWPWNVYGNPTMTMPWWSSVVWKLSMVDSWPPCWVAELVKTLPDLADELALGPELARCVEELAHLAGHVPEPGRRAEDDGAGFSQVVDDGDGHVGERLLGLCRAHGFDYVGGQSLGHALDHRVDTGNFADAVSNRLRDAIDVTVGRVEEHEYFHR